MKLLYLLAIATLLQSAYAATPVQKYVGEWQPDKKYTRGTMVVLKDQTWLCMKACSANEPGSNPDSWARIASTEPGPKGDTGPQGAQGNPGEQGPQGIQGLRGPAGEMGPQGPAGWDGAQGPMGPAGVQGPMGLDGPAGPQGPIGEHGADGPQGPAGPQGLAGIDGAQGPQGPVGATGAIGPAGPRGLQGVQGPAGPAGTPGGIKVYDANNQYLGFLGSISDGGDPFDGGSHQLPTLFSSQLSKFFKLGLCCDGGGFDLTSADIDGSLTNIMDGYSGMPTYYTDNSCSGDEYAYPTSSGTVSNFIGKYNNQNGYVSLLIKGPADIRSIKVRTAQCVPGQYSQNEPNYIEQCSTNVSTTINYYIRNFGGCSSFGLADPCYYCSSQSNPAPTEQLVNYTFTPVTLPFTLPVALPLRYEVQ